MDAAGIGYLQRDNCFTWLEHPEPAQQLLDQQLQATWPALLQDIARSLNPAHEAMFQACPVEYYWSTYQSEWATDILFRDAPSLARLYPKLVHHGLTTFLSPDVMRFLGRKIPPSNKLPPRLEAEVVSNTKVRPEGMRIKHRLGQNSIKMYDKQGSVLRVETTINDPADFKSFRTPEGKPDAAPAWHGMRKGIADLHRRAETSQACNDRYLRALASVEDTTSLGELTARLTVLEQYARGVAHYDEAAGTRLLADLERIKWLLWHGNQHRAQASIGIFEDDVDGLDVAYPNLGKFAKSAREFAVYIKSNTSSLINYGERFRAGERISSCLAESTVNAVISKRFAKRQQMQWTKRGAHLLLQIRTRVLDGTLRSLFEQWYPGLANDNSHAAPQAAAA